MADVSRSAAAGAPRRVLTAMATPDRTVAYGPDPSQVYDVRSPRARPARNVTVVVVHGGFWRAQWDRGHAAPQAAAFAADGFHVAVVEYRRVGMPGGGWPGTGDDVAAAVRAVRADTTLPGRCILVGHSAGGHLVAWAASQPWALGLAGAVSLAGCVDLAMTHRDHLGDDAARRLLGGAGPEVDPAAWEQADPARTSPAVPVVLLHGLDDDSVPPAVSRSYLDAVTRSGDQHAQVRLAVIPGCGHFDLIDPGHPAFERVLQAVRALA